MRRAFLKEERMATPPTDPGTVDSAKKRMPDPVKAAILAAVVAIGIAVPQYYFFQKPTVEIAQRKEAEEKDARLRAEEQVRQQQQQLTALRNQANELRRQFGLAKDQFISRVTDAVTDGVARIPGAEPNRPVPADVVNRTTLQRARRIIDERDKARTGIRQVTGNLDKIYDELDSDIDDLKKMIDTPPVDLKIVQMLLQKIADKWPTKLKLLEQLAQASLQDIGCPIQVALTPQTPQVIPP
jgi:hypothetical protein